ncbi:hypothetical protein TD95_003034 [Thielaviopsis punctulata]|uniref:U-box domain-containing protein n=1 Tax=Thielaviopsis punctulata TaxID=72032 RepID=A0A0F4ZE87_9PEZI|nr:hypothetical protein TD95_003034 [Thielaviopsis punctulata]
MTRPKLFIRKPSILADPFNAVFYNNRAFARIKLKHYEDVVEDCIHSLDLSPKSLKPTYYLSQAHLELGNYEDALSSALQAHALCVANNETKSLGAITQHVLRCKRERWEQIEKKRKREDGDLERETLSLMADAMQRELQDVQDEADRREIEAEWKAKMERTRAIFDTARAKADKRREVPEWAVDDISFGIMVDPVVTKTGKSYERAYIMEYLQNSKIDPITREPLMPEDLRPNLQLREACEEFLNENGWAVDW